MVDNTTLPNLVRFTSKVSHPASSTGSAYDVSIRDSKTDWKIYFHNAMTPSLGTPGLQVTDDDTFLYKISSLPG